MPSRRLIKIKLPLTLQSPKPPFLAMNPAMPFHLRPPRPRSPGIPRLRRIRSAVTEDSTRVTIDLEDVVHYNSGRLENPERIFFDLREARLTSEVAREVARENANVDGDVLTAIRVAQNHAGVVRIVLNVNHVKEYVASISQNPPQLLIDLYRKQPPPAILKIARASHNSSNIHEPTDLRGLRRATLNLTVMGRATLWFVPRSRPPLSKYPRPPSRILISPRSPHSPPTTANPRLPAPSASKSDAS